MLKSFDTDSQFEINLKKISLYIKQEYLLFNDINKILKDIPSHCKTTNDKELNDLSFELSNNFKSISNIHENNKKVLEDNYAKNLELERTTIESLSNIKGD